MRKILIIFTPILLISLVISTFLLNSQPQSTLHSEKKLSNGMDEKLALCVEDSDHRKCFTNYFIDSVKERDSKYLVNQLFLYRDAVPTATQYCHEEALAIGKLAWNEYKNLEEILKFGTPVCASGFLHGVQEAIGEDASIESNSMINLVSKVCDEITNNDFRDSNFRVCFHGIGHAVYKKEGDFNKGMAICETMDDTRYGTVKFEQSYTKRELCSEGFAMRFFEPFQPKIDESKEMPKGKPDNVIENPYSLCDKLKDKSLRYGCFQYGTRAYGHNELDYNRESYLCNQYPPEDSMPCYYGISRELAYSADTDTFDNVTKYCSQAKDNYSGFICGTNAILNRITINNDLNEPIEVCNKFPKTKFYGDICEYVKARLKLTESENKRSIENNPNS